jgi:hypothetical protein
MAIADFPTRLDLALKALNLSRGRLAARLGVDKSVISRWVRGVNGPTDHNLSKLTALVAEGCPGFTMLDWQVDLARLAERLGVTEETVPATGNRPALALDSWLPPGVLNEALAATALRAHVYTGFWRTTRPTVSPPGRFIHDRAMIHRRKDGLLAFRLGSVGIRFEGWALPNQTQLVAAGVDEATGMFIFVILNAVLRDRADVLDGISLTCQRSQGGTPVAAAFLMERTGFLGDDPEADNRRYEASMYADPFAPEGSIPPAIRDHLFRDIGPTALAAGGDAILRMPFAQSMSRGPDPNVPFPD